MKKTIATIAIMIMVVAVALLIVLLRGKSNMRETIPLTANDTGNYEVYKLLLPAEQINNDADVVKFLLKDSQTIGTEIDGETSIVAYTFGSISDYLYMCNEIVDVGTVNGYLYISYSAEDNQDVSLCYNSNGFYNMTIYNEERDECIFISDDKAVKYTNFRHGRFGTSP